jgi:hypothetical protein
MNGAGSHHHSVGSKRPAGERCGNIFHCPREIRQGFHIGCLPAGFQIERLFAGPAEDEVNFHFGTAQFFEKTKRVNCATGSGDSHYYSQMASQKTFFVPKLEQQFTKLIEAGTDRKL